MLDGVKNFYSSKKKIVWWIVLVLIVISSIFGTVGAGERGVLLRFGAVTGKVFNEGLYWKFPLIDSVIIIDTRIQKEETKADSASKDLQIVNATVALNFHIDPTQAAKIYQQVGEDFKDRLIDPAIHETVKASTAKFTAEELITKREEVRDQMKKLITEKLSPHGIYVDEVNIVNFNFSDSFNQAIELKVSAEQQSLAAKNMLEKIKFEAEQKVEEAHGKADATRIEAEALRGNPQMLQLRALEKWDGVLPLVTGNGWVPLINIDSLIGLKKSTDVAPAPVVEQPAPAPAQ